MPMSSYCLFFGASSTVAPRPLADSRPFPLKKKASTAPWRAFSGKLTSIFQSHLSKRAAAPAPHGRQGYPPPGHPKRPPALPRTHRPKLRDLGAHAPIHGKNGRFAACASLNHARWLCSNIAALFCQRFSLALASIVNGRFARTMRTNRPDIGEVGPARKVQAKKKRPRGFAPEPSACALVVMIAPD